MHLGCIRNVTACALAAWAGALPAHHSRAPFDMERTIELEGTVTEVAWMSPHVYIELLATNAAGAAQTWTLEGHSIPGFLRLGWQKDSVQAGDRARIVAHPSRTAGRGFAMLYSVTLRDGRTYYAYQIPEGKSVPGVAPRTATTPSSDFTGTWRHMVPLYEAAIGSFRPPTEWPLTARGRAQVQAWNVNDDPELDCVPMGVPRLILATYSHAWRRSADRIVIEKERSPQVRVIHLTGAARPADFAPSELGFSTGRFEPDGSLVVETTGFTAARWGNARGLDSSDQKRVVERYKLTSDGFRMSVAYTIEDPVYLTEPVTVTGEYQKSADYEFVDEPCDRETARRHLQFQ